MVRLEPHRGPADGRVAVERAAYGAPIPFPPETPLEIALFTGNLVVFVAVGYYAYRTGEALGSRVPLLWVLGMVTPFVSIIVLLTLSSRAAAICRQNGIPVGFFGPKLSSR
jgi:hypothetical protein